MAGKNICKVWPKTHGKTKAFFGGRGQYTFLKLMVAYVLLFETFYYINFKWPAPLFPWGYSKDMAISPYHIGGVAHPVCHFLFGSDTQFSPPLSWLGTL